MSAVAPEPLAPAAKPRRAEEGRGWFRWHILVVDDESGMRSFLVRALAPLCEGVATAATAEEGAALLARQHFDLLILDNALPGKAGVQWLAELREGGFQGEVIVITAFAEIETAIAAVRAGASDFLLKPFRLEQILNAVQRAYERAELERQNYVLRREVEGTAGSIEGLIGQSRAMESLCSLLRRVAPTPSTVLLTGESGSGKEVAARVLHNLSPRAANAFVPVNCAAISPELLESEFFGHTKGAFTGANEAHHGLFYYAQGGTLFLDEVGELPLAMQTKLLRVLEERRIRPVGSTREVPIDVRIIAASNRDLAGAVAQGRFRQDLFYRLNVMQLRVPPLRERIDDVAALFHHFQAQLSLQLGLPKVELPEATRRALQAYDWPGNVRELRNLVERSLILGYIPLESLALADVAAAVETTEQGDAPDLLAVVERRHILRLLRECGGNKSEAARRLGISRRTLERKCALWGEGGA